MSLHNVSPHLRADVVAAIAQANKSLPASKQIELPKHKIVTAPELGKAKSWATRYAEALAEAGWVVNVAQPDFLRLDNKRRQKAMNVAAIEFEFADFLLSHSYHPSPEAFESLRVNLLADVLRQLPRVGGGLLQ